MDQMGNRDVLVQKFSFSGRWGKVEVGKEGINGDERRLDLG